MIEDTAQEKLVSTDTMIETDPKIAEPQPARPVTNELDAMLARRLEKLRMELVIAPNSAVRSVIEGRMEALVCHRNMMNALLELERRIARLETRP